MNTTRTYSHKPDPADKENNRRGEKEKLKEKVRELNDLEANYEDLLFDVIGLRENFIMDPAKIAGKLEEKMNEQYEMLMSRNVKVDIEKIPQHMTDQIIDSINMKERQRKMDIDIDKKLDLIGRLMKL
ncbi:hypothetical protein Ddc_03307 [Ditylenchus destructor]|nr:hypothetical protein Ddc_03307 [Ditylenchus destructor]